MNQSPMNQSPQLSQLECPICLDPLKGQGKALFTTGCGHEFHFACISMSLTQGANMCPLCRGTVSELKDALRVSNTSAPANNRSALRTPALQIPSPVTTSRLSPPKFKFSDNNNALQARTTRHQARTLRRSVRSQRSPRFLPPPQNVLLQNIYTSTTPVSTWPLHMQQEDLNVLETKTGSSAVQSEKTPALNYDVEYKQVTALNSTQIYCSASVIAPPAPSNFARAPMDLIAVVDRSGSMQGPKMRMVKQALQYLITQLTPSDRFSLISFNSNVYDIFALRAATSQHKTVMSEMIEDHPNMQAGGGTNISLGVNRGISSMRDRKLKPAVSSVFLLTDGQGGAESREKLVARLRELHGPLPIHCFGFGRDHDATVMNLIAEASDGSFTYIENDDEVGDAFATCLGGMLSVYAQQVSLVLTPAPDVKITSVHTKYKVQPQGSAKCISIPDMFYDEKRDIVFEVSLPALSETKAQSSIFNVDLSWTDPTTDTVKVCPTITGRIDRSTDQQVDRGPVNPKLDVERNRVIAAGAMTEATALGQAQNLAEARRVLTLAISKLRSSATADRPNVQQLLQDLQDSLSRCVDRQSWNSGGYATCVSHANVHWHQRANSHRSPTYSTPMQRQQQVANAVFNRN